MRATLSAGHWGGGSNTERASKGGEEEEEAHAEGPHSRGTFGKTSPPESRPGYRVARTGGLDGAEAWGSAEIMWGDQGRKGLRIFPARS